MFRFHLAVQIDNFMSFGDKNGQVRKTISTRIDPLFTILVEKENNG